MPRWTRGEQEEIRGQEGGIVPRCSKGPALSSVKATTIRSSAEKRFLLGMELNGEASDERRLRFHRRLLIIVHRESVAVMSTLG